MDMMRTRLEMGQRSLETRRNYHCHLANACTLPTICHNVVGDALTEVILSRAHVYANTTVSRSCRITLVSLLVEFRFCNDIDRESRQGIDLKLSCKLDMDCAEGET